MKSSLLLRAAARTAACLTLATAARSQTFTTLVRDADPVPGVGLVTSIHTFAVNDAGSWVAAVFTDASLDRNLVLLRNGNLHLAESQVMAGTGGFELQAFDGVSINASGNSCWNLFIRGGNPPLTETAVFVDATPVLLKDDPISAPGFTPGTTYVTFSELVYNNVGDAFLIADVDDSQIPGLNDQVAVKLDLQGDVLFAETAVLRRYDTPVGLGGDAVTEIQKDPGEVALNDLGQVALVARTNSGRAALLLDTNVVAREKDSSPVPGRRWQSLTSRPLDLNRHGAVLFRADLDGDVADDEVVVLSDAQRRHSIAVREGDPIETPDGIFHIEGFGGARVALSDGNDVVVFVDWDQPDTTRDQGLLYNGRLVVQEGVTQVEGTTVVSIGDGTPRLFSISPDGKRLAFQCMLENFVDALVLVDLSGLPGPFCDASDGAFAQCPCAGGGVAAGCEIAHGTGGVRLRPVLQTATPLNRATLIGTGFPSASSTPSVLLRAGTRDPGGAAVFGNGLRCVGLPVARLAATLADDGRATHAIGHGAGAGAGTFHYQLWFRDTPLSYCDPASGFNLSNGHELRWP